MDNNLKPFCHREPNHFIDDLFSFDDFSDVPTTPGAYIFASKEQEFTYPNGKSRIIYIGKSENLRSRLQTHRRVITELSSIKEGDRNGAWWYTRYQYLTKFGCRAYFFTIRGTQAAKNLENLLLENFYDKYLALPVGNGAVSYRKTK